MRVLPLCILAIGGISVLASSTVAGSNNDDDALPKFVEVAEQIHKAAKEQRQLADETARLLKRLGAQRKTNSTAQKKREFAPEYEAVASEQRRIARAQEEVGGRVIDCMRAIGELKDRVGEHQRIGLTQCEKLAAKHKIMSTLYKIRAKLQAAAPDESWRVGNVLQKRLAGQFGELAATLDPKVGKEASHTPVRPIAGAPLWGEFERIHNLIKPGPGEWKFARIPWVPTLVEARLKAAKEGKPLLIWHMLGEPLGQC